MQQFSMDFEQKLPVSAQIGMKAADDHANVLWKRVTDAAILAVARRMPEFTVDDVLDELESIPEAPSTHNLSALGPRMKEVSQTLGYMVATDRHRRSRRKVKNGNLHRIWQSKFYQGASVER
jgi:hypothetical protein